MISVKQHDTLFLPHNSGQITKATITRVRNLSNHVCHGLVKATSLLQLPYSYRKRQNGNNGKYGWFSAQIFNKIDVKHPYIRYGQIGLQFVIIRSWVRIPQVAPKYSTQVKLTTICEHKKGLH